MAGNTSVVGDQQSIACAAQRRRGVGTPRPSAVFLYVNPARQRSLDSDAGWAAIPRLPELAEKLLGKRGIAAHPASLSRLLCRAGFTYKKQLMASECERPDVAERRRQWIVGRQPLMRCQPWRLVFLDETSVTTKLASWTLAQPDLHRRVAL